MITWIQRFFLKHNKWLFGSLLVVIVVTFVLTIGPQSFFGGGGGYQQKEISFYGYDLSSQADQQAMFAEAEISAMLNPQLQIRQDNLANYAYLRVAGLGIARQLGVPEPSEDQMAEYIRTKMIFQDPQTGAFSAEQYNQILEILKSSGRFSTKSMARVLAQDYQIEEISKALSGPTYLLPKELKADYIQRNSTYNFIVGQRSFSDFDPGVEVTEEAAREFYQDNPTRYQVPEQIEVAAVVFNRQNFLGEVSDPDEATLSSYFNMNSAKYQPTATEDNPEPAEVTLEDVRDQVITEWKLAEAKGIAEENSELFSLALWEQNLSVGTPEFNSLVTKHKGDIVDIPPYSQGAAPSLSNIPASLLNSIWTYRDSTRNFSEIGQNREGAVIVVIENILDPRLPAYEELADQVKQDYIASEKRRLFAAEGPIVKEEILAAISTGESPSTAMEAADLIVENLDAFIGSEVPATLRSNSLWQVSRYLSTGEMTDMLFSGENGYYVYAQSVDIAEVDPGSEEYQAFVESQTGGDNSFIGWSRLRQIVDNSFESLGLGGGQ